MTDSISIDDSELRAYAADLTAAGSGMAARVRPVVEKGAINIKNQLRREAQASRHFKGMARAIGYDMHTLDAFGVGVIEAEIGPSSEAGSPGNLANIAIFGTSRGGGTVPDPQGALDAEAPRFTKALEDLLGNTLG